MATEQLFLQSQKHTASWLSLFPYDIKTLSGSKNFVKRLTALTLSCITYMRSIFPEYAFYERELDGMKVKVLAGNYDCRDAYLMTKWIKSSFEALDKKYMRELVFEILSEDMTPLEYYAIVYKYTEDGPECALTTTSEVNRHLDFDLMKTQNATKEMITMLLTFTEYLGQLPEKYTLQMRINYYDEVTPPRYKPKFFNNAEALDRQQLSNMYHQQFGGEVETPYYTFSLYGGSSLVDELERTQSFEILFENPEEGLRSLAQSEEVEDARGASQSESIVVSLEKFWPKEEPTSPPEVEQQKLTWTLDSNQSQDNPMTAATQAVPSSGRTQVACPCGHDYEKDQTSPPSASEIFRCDHCTLLQHLVCYKKDPMGHELSAACCYPCATSVLSSERPECTDPSLLHYSVTSAKNLMVYRQVLYRLQVRKTFSMRTFDEMGIIRPTLRELLVGKLKKEVFIKSKKGSQRIFNINKAKLKTFIKTYFER